MAERNGIGTDNRIGEIQATRAKSIQNRRSTRCVRGRKSPGFIHQIAELNFSSPHQWMLRIRNNDKWIVIEKFHVHIVCINTFGRANKELDVSVSHLVL